MNLDEFVAPYRGHLRVKRLLSLADNVHDKKVKLQVVLRVLDELKKGVNTQLYVKTIEHYKKLSEKLTPDLSWVDKTNKDCGKRLEQLELEFNTFKTSSLKENLRKVTIELGEFYYSRGEFQNALKRFLRIRDHATTPQHVSQMCLLIIKAALEMDNYAVVAQYLNRARQVCDKDDLVLRSKLDAIGGLCDIHNANFKPAAFKFLRVNVCIQNQYNDVIACKDVAMYGTLLALATFDRKELRVPEGVSEKARENMTTLIDNAAFQNFIEFEPRLLGFCDNFYDGRYAQFFKQLELLRSAMYTDVYLRQYGHILYQKIRSKALIQYVRPFSSIDMKSMADLFEMKLGDLENDLVHLIQSKQIKAKIDSYKKVFYSIPQDEKERTYEQITEMGDEYMKDVEMAILRMNMLKYKNFVIHPMKKSRKKQMDEMDVGMYQMHM